MFCSNCGKEQDGAANFCHNCGKSLSKTETKKEEVGVIATPSVSKNVPWHQDFKGRQIILISLFSLVLYFATDAEIFDWIFLIGLIFGIVKSIQEFRSKK